MVGNDCVYMDDKSCSTDSEVQGNERSGGNANNPPLDDNILVAHEETKQGATCISSRENVLNTTQHLIDNNVTEGINIEGVHHVPQMGIAHIRDANNIRCPVLENETKKPVPGITLKGDFILYSTIESPSKHVSESTDIIKLIDASIPDTRPKTPKNTLSTSQAPYSDTKVNYWDTPKHKRVANVSPLITDKQPIQVTGDHVSEPNQPFPHTTTQNTATNQCIVPSIPTSSDVATIIESSDTQHDTINLVEIVDPTPTPEIVNSTDSEDKQSIDSDDYSVNSSVPPDSTNFTNVENNRLRNKIFKYELNEKKYKKILEEINKENMFLTSKNTELGQKLEQKQYIIDQLTTKFDEMQIELQTKNREVQNMQRMGHRPLNIVHDTHIDPEGMYYLQVSEKKLSEQVEEFQALVKECKQQQMLMKDLVKMFGKQSKGKFVSKKVQPRKSRATRPEDASLQDTRDRASSSNVSDKNSLLKSLKSLPPLSTRSSGISLMPSSSTNVSSTHIDNVLVELTDEERYEDKDILMAQQQSVLDQLPAKQSSSGSSEKAKSKTPEASQGEKLPKDDVTEEPSNIGSVDKVEASKPEETSNIAADSTELTPVESTDEDQICIFCNMSFPHMDMSDFQEHMLECSSQDVDFQTLTPTNNIHNTVNTEFPRGDFLSIHGTHGAAVNDEPYGAVGGSDIEQICPVCNTIFTLPIDAFYVHVNSHFDQ